MELKITPETVCSQGYDPLVAQACMKAFDRVNAWERSREWRFYDTGWATNGGHFPDMWGSGWGVDVPIYLNLMAQEFIEPFITDFAQRLWNGDDHCWKAVFRVSELVRRRE